MSQQHSNDQSDTLQAENAVLRRRIAKLETLLQVQTNENEETLHALLNAIQESALLIDPQGTVLQANQTVAERLGTIVPQMIGKNTFDFVSPDVADKRKKAVAQVVATGKLVRFEDIRNDRYIDNVIAPVFDNTGSVTRLAIYGFDITERKCIESSLRQSEQKFRGVIEQSSDGINLADEDGILIEWNHGAEQITGLHHSEVIGLPYWDVLFRLMPSYLQTSAYYEQSKQLLQHFFQTGDAPWLNQITEQTFCHTDGHQLIAQQRCFAIKTAKGFMACAIFRDITYQKNIESALRKAHDEMEQRVQERTAELLQANIALQTAQNKRIQIEQHLQFQARLLDTIGQAVIATALDGTITYWNYAAEMLTTISAQQAIGIPINTIIPERAYQEALLDGQATEEIVLYTPDGTAIPVLETRTPIHDDDGTFTGIISVYTDITNRKHAEHALAQSEQHYRTLVEISPDAIFLTDIDGTIRFCNQQAAMLFGYFSPDQLCGKQGTDLIASTYLHANPLVHLQQIVDIGNVRNIEYIMSRSDGSFFPAEVSSSVVTDPLNQPIALIIVVHDITSRKQAQQAIETAYTSLKELNQDLRHSRNLLRALIDGLEDGLLLINGNGIVQTLNRAMTYLLGTSPESLIGGDWNELYPRIAPDFPGHLVLKASLTQEKHYENIRYRRPDRTTCILEIHIITLLSPQQTIQQIIVHVTDVTERIQLHARAIENERFAASGRLAASVAHEINTPLQSVQTAIELAQIVAEAERQTYLQDAIQELQRVGRIVEQLLDLYRPSAATPLPLDIPELIERILLLIGKRFRDQGVTIQRHFPTSLKPLNARADQLMQVFLNILINALDAMPDGGTLSITANLCDVSTLQQDNIPGIKVDIKDSGIGIRKEILPHIFEPFVTTRHEGTGLGLAISNQIVQSHNGHITVQSVPDEGSTFSIFLPLQYH